MHVVLRDYFSCTVATLEVEFSPEVIIWNDRTFVQQDAGSLYYNEASHIRYSQQKRPTLWNPPTPK